VTVSFDWSPDRSAVQVANSAPRPLLGGSASPTPGTGNGLLSMCERAIATGGHLAAQRIVDGRFQVDAEILMEQPTATAGRAQ
jgi:hypothetical protein